MTSHPGRLKPWFSIGLKILFVSAIAYYLVEQGHFSLEATQTALKQPQKILLALFYLVAAMSVTCFRWHLLLRAQGIVLNWKRTFQLTWVGHFFNVSLPGAVSGDVVKAIYVGREVAGKRAWALSSILFDRLAGVSGLILISVIAMGVGYGEGWNKAGSSGIRTFVVLASLAVTAFYAYLFLVSDERDPLQRVLAQLKTKGSIFQSLEKIYSGIRLYREKKLAVFFTLGLSVVIHFFVVSACFIFADALGSSELDFFAIASVVPLGLLVTAIPITPGGVGTGHIAFTFLFGLIGQARGADTFNLFYAGQLSLGLLGGLVYLQFKSQSKLPVDLEAESSNL